MVGTVYFDKYVSPAAKLTEGVSIDDYSTWRAVRSDLSRREVQG